MSHYRKAALNDPRDQRGQRKRLLTELSTKPFAIPEDEYGTHRVPIRPVLHPLTPEYVPAPPESNMRSALRSINWRLIGWTGFATSVAAGLALIAVEVLPVNDAGHVEVPFPSMEQLRAFVAPPASSSVEAATKIADDFDSLAVGQTQLSETEQDKEATLRRLMEWERNAQATPPR